MAATPGTLQFRDIASCVQWIAKLPITNVQVAQQMLTEQVVAMAATVATELAPLDRLTLLESLKETAHFAQAEVAKRYIGKPLPLDEADGLAWTAVVDLWNGLNSNYRQCLDAYRAGDLTVAPHAALIALRCLRTASFALFEHYQVYREPDAAAWRGFHEVFAYAEEQGLSRTRVQDTFSKRDADNSCADAYVQGLMAYLANPFALSVRQMAFFRRWLENWASIISLSSQALPAGQIPPLGVDIAADAPPGLAAQLTPGPSVRYLDLEQLSKTLRQTINLLKQGQTPGQLGLGEDARQPGCENLIMLLYLQWCRAGTLRTEQRNAVGDPAEVCFGIDDTFKLLGGEDRSVQQMDFNARDKWELDNLGFSMRLSNTARQAAVKKSEAWLIVNQSLSGFMCMLREPSGLMRMTHNQLLGIRRGEDAAKIGTVQWISIDSKNECLCGVRVFPGAPAPIKVRQAGFNQPKGQPFELALMTPAVSMPAAPMAMILPAGWFQPGRFIEIQGNDKQVAKLLNLIERGADFDRCAITLVEKV